MLYELFYLIGASKESELEKIKLDASEIITSNGGVFQEKETLEKRKMAYEIKHETHGIYITQRFEMDPEKTVDITKKLNLHPGVLRFVLSRAQELPELKSKEERMAESQLRERTSAIVEKTRKETRKEDSAPVRQEKKAESQEDIDKKLEEILNI